ncbi:MAG: hypothetical protein ACFFDW_03480 [Candidatus Thorarchaeota archaeon]
MLPPKVKLILFFGILFNLVPNFLSLNTLGVNLEEQTFQSNYETPNQFPFVGQYMVYDVTQTTAGIPAASGTLTVNYDEMLDADEIHGFFHVEVISIIEYYNETASGSENLQTRHLNIDAKNTYVIYLFMVYFFDWTGLTPTPMWIFPEDVALSSSVRFWNYTAVCLESQSISIMDHYYEVFVFRASGTFLTMTLMYGFARNGESGYYGLLFYMKGAFYEPSIDNIMEASFKLSDTNVELVSLGEINRNSILITTVSFYSVIVIGTFIYRIKTRRDLVGGDN